MPKPNRKPHSVPIKLRERLKDREIQLLCIHTLSHLAANQTVEIVPDPLQGVWWHRLLYHWAENVVEVEDFHLVSKFEGGQVGVAEFGGSGSGCFCFVLLKAITLA